MVAAGQSKKLSKLAKEFNVGISTIVEFLTRKGIAVDSNPNSKVAEDVYLVLLNEYSSDITVKKESEELSQRASRTKKETISIEDIEDDDSGHSQDNEAEVLIKHVDGLKNTEIHREEIPKRQIKVVGKIELEATSPKKKIQAKEETKQEVKVAVTPKKAEILVASEPVISETEAVVKEEPKVVGRIDLGAINQKTRPARKSKEVKDKEKKEKESVRKEKQKDHTSDVVSNKDENRIEATSSPVVAVLPKIKEQNKEEFIKTRVTRLSGPTVVGRIELPVDDRKDKSDFSAIEKTKKKKKRKRIKKDIQRIDVSTNPTTFDKDRKELKKVSSKSKFVKAEISDEDVQKQIKDTLSRLTSKGSKSKGSKYRRDKRDAVSLRTMEESEKLEKDKNILKVTEFVTANELSSMMNVPVNEIISTCMNLGLFVSINQRLDAETMSLLAEEFGFEINFISVEVQEAIAQDEDREEDLVPRPPIVTVMGHVDHGKTKLLDYIRNSNVVAGEAGGITQHIGAYNVSLDDGRRITFLDTPGHEAFTAMRARGAQITDVSIIVVAADDGVKPQTIEAINHAHAAGVPIVFAINKIDKPQSNVEKVKEELANMNFLVEDWGGKYQSQEISAKQGINIPELMEKVLLEAEMLELRANPNKNALGTVIESSLDKGRGYVTTILVEGGTLRVGDVMLAGSYTGHVKAMYNERNQKITEAGPATPVLILGLDGAPQAGDKFNVMESDKEAREIANKRNQLQREQGLRTQKHITLDEIGRRIAIGNFQELNIIVKGDVDGSIEALSDSLIKQSTAEIQVNIIHKAVGQISESDVMLAAASNAIIVGFQVRPSVSARKLAEKEEIDIRLYSIIYDALNEIKDAMEGMLSPEIKEEIVATVEVREVFKITKVGTIAGCMVTDGKITRNSKIRIIRDGIVVYTGILGSLRRFKEDVKDVIGGYECGLNIDKYNDIKVGDIIEGFIEKEVKKTLN